MSIVSLIRWSRNEDPRIGFSALKKAGYKFVVVDRGRKTKLYVVITDDRIPWSKYGFEEKLVADIIYSTGTF